MDAYLASKPAIFTTIYRIARSNSLESMVIAVVIGNTITLSLDAYNISDSLSARLAIANIVFSCLFGVEMVVKLTGRRITFLNPFPRVVSCHTISGVVHTLVQRWCVVFWTGFGFRAYFSRMANCFDAIVVVSSFIEIIFGKACGCTNVVVIAVF